MVGYHVKNNLGFELLSEKVLDLIMPHSSTKEISSEVYFTRKPQAS